ncbi:MAG: DsrE family protein [Thiolinea sp.]
MKTPFKLSTLLFAVLILSGLMFTAYAHETDMDTEYALVIQMNTNDVEKQEHVLSNIVNLQKHYGMDNISIEVVAYGPGIWMVTDKSEVAERVESLMLQNVAFTACGNTLDTVERDSGTRPTLLDDIETTQAGIARIIELQNKGWNYLSP